SPARPGFETLPRTCETTPVPSSSSAHRSKRVCVYYRASCISSNKWVTPLHTRAD
ncbi:unnamed protein product, partial [Pylaiella littoralis]